MRDSSTTGPGTAPEGGEGLVLAKRAAMAAATAFLAINIWTGAPVFALWVGSRVVQSTTLSMTAVFVVIGVLGALELAMLFALTWLDAAYNDLTGRPLRESRLAWLRSMNTQHEPSAPAARTSVLEGVVMASVYLAVVTFAVWFFFFAGSPLPG